MSGHAEYFTDELVEKIRSTDGSTLVWRKDGSTLVYFDFESPAVLLIEVRDAEIVPASNTGSEPK